MSKLTSLLVPGAVGLLMGLAAPAGWAHGDLGPRIAALSADLEGELARPVDAHARARLYLERGELYRLHRELGRAARDYDEAERHEPGSPAIQLARARMLVESGRDEEARAALEQLLRQTPASTEARLLQAQVLVALGQEARAVDELDQALQREAQPEPDHYLTRAEILAGLGKPHLARAIAGLDEGIARLGPLVALDSRAIELELELGHPDRALVRIDRQAAATVRKDLWLARRAEVLERAGRRSQARAARRAALRALQALPPPLQQRPGTQELRHRLSTALAPTGGAR